jgi:hypothetical protein
MRTFNLPNGGTVTFTRKGVGYDVHLRDASGATTATLDLSDWEAHEMMRAAGAA